MRLFEVTIIDEPCLIERQAGRVEKIPFSDKVVAKEKCSAVAGAVILGCRLDKFEGADLPNLSIVVTMLGKLSELEED